MRGFARSKLLLWGIKEHGHEPTGGATVGVSLRAPERCLSQRCRWWVRTARGVRLWGIDSHQAGLASPSDRLENRTLAQWQGRPLVLATVGFRQVPCRKCPTFPKELRQSSLCRLSNQNLVEERLIRSCSCSPIENSTWTPLVEAWL